MSRVWGLENEGARHLASPFLSNDKKLSKFRFVCNNSEYWNLGVSRNIILWHVNQLFGCAAGFAQRSVARQRPLNNSRQNTRCAAVRGGGVFSAQPRWRHATALEYGFCATVPRSRDDVTYVYMVARRRVAILSDNSGRSAYGSSPGNRQRNNAMTIARKSLAQLGYISEAVSSLQFSSVPGVTVKKSVFKK
jgi:hypothetical protein